MYTDAIKMNGMGSHSSCLLVMHFLNNRSLKIMTTKTTKSKTKFTDTKMVLSHTVNTTVHSLRVKARLEKSQW